MLIYRRELQIARKTRRSLVFEHSFFLSKLMSSFLPPLPS